MKQRDKMVKARLIKRIAYDADFEPEMESFQRNIKLDTRMATVAKNKNVNQRFSAAIRALIRAYNKKMKEVHLKDAKSRTA